MPMLTPQDQMGPIVCSAPSPRQVVVVVVAPVLEDRAATTVAVVGALEPAEIVRVDPEAVDPKAVTEGIAPQEAQA